MFHVCSSLTYLNGLAHGIAEAAFLSTGGDAVAELAAWLDPHLHELA